MKTLSPNFIEKEDDFIKCVKDIEDFLDSLKCYKQEGLEINEYKNKLDLIDIQIMSNLILREEIYRRGKYFENLRNNPKANLFVNKIHNYINKCTKGAKANINLPTEKIDEEIRNIQKYKLSPGESASSFSRFLSHYRNIFILLKENDKSLEKNINRYEKILNKIEMNTNKKLRDIDYGAFKMYLYIYENRPTYDKYYNNIEKANALDTILRQLKIFINNKLKEHEMTFTPSIKTGLNKPLKINFDENSTLKSLSPAEREIFLLIGQRYNINEIAAYTHKSKKTINTQISSTASKLQSLTTKSGQKAIREVYEQFV